MKHIALTFILIALASSSVFSQEEGPIRVEKKGVIRNYYYDGVLLEKHELGNYLGTNPASEVAFKNSRDFRIAAVTMAVGAGICALVSFYYGCSSFISWLDCNGRAWEELERSAYWELAGSAFVLGSIALGISYSNSLTRSIKLYNDSVRPQGFLYDARLYFGVTGNGIGISLRF